MTVVNTSRPKTLSPEMAMNAARKVAARLVESNLLDGDLEEIARDIAKHGRLHMDGYELAKTLDDRCYWDCDLMVADELDSFSSEAREEIDAAERQWAAEMNITPPYPDGTRVSLRTGELGIIDRVSKYGVAKFEIAIDGEKADTRRIVNFEDVAPVAQGIEAFGEDPQGASSRSDESPTPQSGGAL